ncbi:MAG: deoxyribonuclease IV [Verrucomicrobiae bacterium]|nr:deoxyribonuclease IV [Verrucomicrobiae bacterium]
MKFGAHMSIAGGVDKAIERGRRVGCEAIQIFTRGNMQWQSRPLRADEIAEFKRLRAATAIAPVFAHNCYLINLGATNPLNLRRSIEAMVDELQRADALALPFVVAHPGAHMGAGEAAGLRRIAASLREVLGQTRGSPVKIALEITAGQGTCLGHRFEHLAELIERVGPERLAVCLDTAHLLAAGYDIRDAAGVGRVAKEFARIIGWKFLVAVHLNDSKAPLGSRVDRHEHIGKGQIGRAGFRAIVNHPRFCRVPGVLETPKGDFENESPFDKLNLRLLRSLAAPARK